MSKSLEAPQIAQREHAWREADRLDGDENPHKAHPRRPPPIAQGSGPAPPKYRLGQRPGWVAKILLRWWPEILYTKPSIRRTLRLEIAAAVIIFLGAAVQAPIATAQGELIVLDPPPHEPICSASSDYIVAGMIPFEGPIEEFVVTGEVIDEATEEVDVEGISDPDGFKPWALRCGGSLECPYTSCGVQVTAWTDILGVAGAQAKVRDHNLNVTIGRPCFGVNSCGATNNANFMSIPQGETIVFECNVFISIGLDTSLRCWIDVFIGQ